MIDRQQLVAALGRLDPRELEVLDLSLRRRVPDDALANVYGLDAAEVARRRTEAIERLSKDLDIQRGSDLGHMLQALLEPETWVGVIPLEGEEEAEPEEGAEPEEAAPEPAEEAEPELVEETQPEPELAAVPDTGPAPEPVPEAGAGPAEEAEPDSESAAPEAGEPREDDRERARRPEPVLEMLGHERPAEHAGARRRRGIAALAAAATVLLPAAGIVAASTLGDQSDDGGQRSGSQTRTFVPHENGPLGQPFASDPQAVSGYTVARISRTTVLHASPGGKAKLRLSPRTEWGTPRIMGVVRQRGEWLAVQVPELDNGQLGWLRAGEARLSTVPWSLHVDLSNRQLIVRKDGHFVRRITIAVGAPGHPTPQGRYSITDKLKVTDAGSPYGCCVLATSAHQTKLPPGWPGGDRVAVHATSDLTSIGQAVSLGCMRAESDQARWLLSKIPLGSPIFVRA